MTNEHLNIEIQRAIDLRKDNVTESLKILNNLLNEELENNDRAYIYFEISIPSAPGILISVIKISGFISINAFRTS